MSDAVIETYKHIEIMLHEEGKKTNVWAVFNKSKGAFLGLIRWVGGWRQYIFAPEAATYFSVSCLQDIQDFIKDRMEERK